MLTCKEEPLIWSTVTSNGGSKSKSSILNHKKSSTLAGWSNLPGKSLLIDQLARLKSKNGDNKVTHHASSGNLDDSTVQSKRPSHEWLNIEKSVRFQLPEKTSSSCSIHSKTATLPPLHRGYDVESMYPPIFFVPASIESDPRFHHSPNASIIVKSPMSSLGKSHSAYGPSSLVPQPFSSLDTSKKSLPSFHTDPLSLHHHHGQTSSKVHFKKADPTPDTHTSKAYKSLNFFSWRKPSSKTGGVKKAKSISVLTEVVTDDPSILLPDPTSVRSKSVDKSPNKLPRVQRSTSKEKSQQQLKVKPVTKQVSDKATSKTVEKPAISSKTTGSVTSKQSSLKSIVKATKIAVTEIHSKHSDAKNKSTESVPKDEKDPESASTTTVASASGGESDPGYESDPANKLLDDLASASVEIPDEAVFLPFPITVNFVDSLSDSSLLEQQSVSASQTLRAALCKVEANHPGFAYDLVLGLVRKGDVSVNMNESLLRLQGTISEQENGEYRSSRTEEPFQELNKKSAALKKILSRIPDEITDRKTFLETIKEIASAIKKLLDAVNEVSAYIPGSQGKHALEQRKREFVKYSKRFSNTLKEFFKEGQPNSVFASATYLIYQTNQLMITVKDKCE
ncbi:uncharacterized protein LOC131878790 isoform X1 [Tigriopus californicus]|uniref:uncharacterized protein LOC131878790 isoform X1 n=1 Tax=Tigriopus californicus TaxID=6832 RepID=UPI0027D9E8BA|nr:uncharacterized protein LOC131878790 isoform X1 [Tigriopus californicus]